MRYRGAALATALLAMPLAAAAQPVTGPYVSGAIGGIFPQNSRITPGAPSIDGAGHLRLDRNWGIDGEAAIGYGMGNGFRFEIEGDFMRNGIHEMARLPFAASHTGVLRNYGVMVNALYDMDIGQPHIFPYVGIGAGYQWTTFHDFSANEVGGPFSISSGDTRGRPAGQLIAGVSMPIAGVPGLSATLAYHLMYIFPGGSFNALETPTTGGPPIDTHIKLGQQLDHVFLVGLRYALYTPKPPAPEPAAAPQPVAAPAPAPSRSYLVFFDWDKATLTNRARAIIHEAAENSTRVQYTRIDVNGYTDTSGTPQYNMGLSIRRARAVAGELVRDGVPENVIAIKGFGETHLLVPTGPGVREPQNRRVEIIIQ